MYKNAYEVCSNMVAANNEHFITAMEKIKNML